MKRIELEKEVVLSFEGVQYEITETLGIGATCIAYKAKRQDGTVFCLKECYPDTVKISRNEDQSLVWADESERKAFFSRFCSAYNKMKELYSINEIKNSSPIPIGCFEENETIYYLSDLKYGNNFEDDEPSSLSDIITVGITLSKLIKAYHSKGYLHLDIKPENIFLMPETREMLVLFDVDSIIPVNDLKDGLIKSISFSKDFSAPEQRDFNISKISEQTDFYAIGSTLFYKIMGRKVCSFDRGLFADWDFSENKYFENINPKTQNAVAEFFKKTLSLNPKDRFFDADSLINALREIKDLSEEKIYINKSKTLPSTISNFVGRKRELEKIQSAFLNGKKMIFLQGFGGIGKSELAKNFAHNSAYPEIIFLEYKNSLRDTLNKISVNAMEDASFEEKESVLKQGLTPDHLLIIDNFDVMSDDYLGNLSTYDTNIILTTRTDFSDYDCSDAEFINIGCLNKETLLSLFILESGLCETDSDDEDFILKTLELYLYHTMFVRPLAYKIQKLGFTPESLYEESKKELLNGDDTVNVTKDGKFTQETINSLAKKLFRIEDLTPRERHVLSELYFLNGVGINLQMYRENVCHRKQKGVGSVIANLVQKGIVQKEELSETLSLHPVIMELVNELFNPNVTSCSDAAEYINTLVDAFLNKKLNSPEIPVTLIRSASDFPLHIISILSQLDMRISENSDYALELIFKICSNPVYEYLAKLFCDIISVFDEKDIKVKLLNFLCEFTSIFNKSLSAHSAHREEEMVEYIVSFYKEYDDGSDLFGRIFWQMILFYHNHLESFKSMGWNFSLLEKLQNCMKMQNESGLSLYEYVFDSTDPDIAYIDENGNWIDEGNLVLACQNIEEIFTHKQQLAKEYGVSTEDRTSSEIYKDCIRQAIAEYDTAMRPYKNKTELSAEEKENAEKIYKQINNNELLSAAMKSDIISNYAPVFVNFDPFLAYPPDYPAAKMMSELLEDTSFEPKEIIGHLKYCAVQIVGNGRRMTMKEHKKFMECIKDFSRTIELCDDYIYLAHTLLSKILFSCFMTQPELFGNEMNHLIDRRIAWAEKELVSGEKFIVMSTFGTLLNKVSEEEKANELYGFLREYFEKVHCLYEKSRQDNVYIMNHEKLLSDCMNCASAAFKETGAEFYKEEYIKLKKYLKKQN